ncbi:MAG: response regulator [Anaerolineales bacterium]|jgi:DNA-binding NarL/FixJ family response regulator
MNRKRVMIVEDQREIARMIHSAIQLMDASLDIVDALSAEEASLELSERGADLIILDVRLPGISGLELLERWRIQHIDIPVIVTTGFAEPAIRALAERLGARAFFNKPLPMEDFLRAVRSILAGEEFQPSEDQTAHVLTDLRQMLAADAAWLCQETGQATHRAGDVLEVMEEDMEAVQHAVLAILNRTTPFLGKIKEEPPSVIMLYGEKRNMAIVPMPSGPSLVLFLSKPVPAQTLDDAITEAMHRLEKIFHTDKLLQEVSEVIPMPDWVQQSVGSAASQPQEWNITAPQVEPLEAKTFWDEAVLQAGGFLSPGKLTFDEAEKLGLVPEAKPNDPYRVID